MLSINSSRTSQDSARYVRRERGGRSKLKKKKFSLAFSRKHVLRRRIRSCFSQKYVLRMVEVREGGGFAVESGGGKWKGVDSRRSDSWKVDSRG